MGDEPTGPHGAGSDPTSGLPPPSPRGAARDVTRATAPGDPGVARASGAPRSVPARIGRYAIVRVLGEGGMGTVYEAQQESPKRTVALKVIRAGYLSPELLRRFTQESQVLGRLQHPGIAQVYEAGVFVEPPTEVGGPHRPTPSIHHPPTSVGGSTSIPFFAMEFIKGVPLTEFINKKGLGTRDRLELVAKVCDAVYHAHQKGVIHRDLKPGNILVDESGQPKILDFGIARATDSDIQQTTLQTDIGQLVGTIPYMSPEQVGGDPNELDTRSDVYALGVITYEILAGRLPYDLQRKMIHEAARIIKEEEPTRLSSINRTLRGDVETIVAKALEKDKVRRYQSAESLASDIRRYLKHEPITARPASTWYQASKFARRHTGLVAGLAAAFILLIAGVIGTSIGLRQAVIARDNERAARTEADAQRDAAVKAREAEAEQRKAAESQRDKAEKITEFMSDTLQGAGPSVAKGRDITMLKEMMDSAAARIEKGDLKSAPEAELRLRGTIGDTYRELALFGDAARMLEPAVAIARSLPGVRAIELSRCLHNLASLCRDRDDLGAAETLFRESLDLRKRAHPRDHPSVAQALNDLASLVQRRGDAAEAESLFREAMDMNTRLHPNGDSALATVQSNLAILLESSGRLNEAEPLLRRAVKWWRDHVPGDLPALAEGVGNLGGIHERLGDMEGAEPLLREALAMKRRLYAPEHPAVALSANSLARHLFLKGDLAGAEPLFREALEARRHAFPGDHSLVAESLTNLAMLLRSRGDPAAAEPLAREALEMDRRLYPGDHEDIAFTLNNLAVILHARGDSDGAEARFRESIEMKRRLTPGGSADIAQSLSNLATVIHMRGDLARAEPLYREAVDTLRRLYPGDSPDVALALSNLASLLRSRGNLAAAEPLLREAIAMYDRVFREDHWYKAATHLTLGRVLAGLNRFAEAEPELLEAERMAASAQGVPPGSRLAIVQSIAAFYSAWDKAEPGNGYDAKAAAWKAKPDAVAPSPEPAGPPDTPPK